VEILGKLVKLRALVAADAVPAAQALQDPEVVRWLEGWARRPYSADDFLEFINRRRVDAVTWAIECVEDGEFVGATGLHELDFRNRHCFWGIWIGPSTRWDRGYGSEACRLCMQYAFDELGMEKVYLHVYEGNHRGRRAYEKPGSNSKARSRATTSRKEA
jgi:RimJ/RimL family protein N-acetyltransferase